MTKCNRCGNNFDNFFNGFHWCIYCGKQFMFDANQLREQQESKHHYRGSGGDAEGPRKGNKKTHKV
ncbi:hypothetical protein J4430_02445 [Candidatus Woesearchaeota archaeon]|nr:hypothetical protein [Candidatus Woesearchaeota archaeon]